MKPVRPRNLCLLNSIAETSAHLHKQVRVLELVLWMSQDADVNKIRLCRKAVIALDQFIPRILLHW